MKRGFKPYNKRKTFKRKAGGGKFMLGGGRGKDVSFSMPSSMNKDVFAGMSNLISSILGQKRVYSNIKTGNK